MSEEENPKLLAILPKIPASLSLLGSIAIIYEVISDGNIFLLFPSLFQKRRRKNYNNGFGFGGRSRGGDGDYGDYGDGYNNNDSHHHRHHHRKKKLRGASIQRVLLAMSCYDLFSSFTWFVSTWPMPSETNNAPPYAVGNMSTCTMVGFLYQFGLMGTYMSNSTLALISLFIVKYNWPANKLHSLEWKVHTTIFVISFSAAVICIPLELYNPSLSTCHIEAYPPGCTQSWQQKQKQQQGDDTTTTTTCERGDNSFLYSLFFNGVLLWLCVTLSVIAMIQIYRYVSKIESTVQRYQQHQDSHPTGFSGDLSTGSTTDLHHLPTSTTPNKKEESKEEEQEEVVVGGGDDDNDVESEDCSYPTSTNDDDGNNEQQQSVSFATTTTTTSQQQNILGVGPSFFSLDFSQRISNILKKQKTRNKEESNNSSCNTTTNKRTNKQQQQQQQDHQRATIVGYQAIFYVGAFLVTYLPPTIAVILWNVSIYSRIQYYMVLICLPLQGFWNFVVFARQRPKMKGIVGRILRSLLYCECLSSSTSSCFNYCCCHNRRENDMGNNNNDDGAFIIESNEDDFLQHVSLDNAAAAAAAGDTPDSTNNEGVIADTSTSNPRENDGTNAPLNRCPVENNDVYVTNKAILSPVKTADGDGRNKRSAGRNNKYKAKYVQNAPDVMIRGLNFDLIMPPGSSTSSSDEKISSGNLESSLGSRITTTENDENKSTRVEMTRDDDDEAFHNGEGDDAGGDDSPPPTAELLVDSGTTGYYYGHEPQEFDDVCCVPEYKNNDNVREHQDDQLHHSGLSSSSPSSTTATQNDAQRQHVAIQRAVENVLDNLVLSSNNNNNSEAESIMSSLTSATSMESCHDRLATLGRVAESLQRTRTLCEDDIQQHVSSSSSSSSASSSSSSSESVASSNLQQPQSEVQNNNNSSSSSSSSSINGAAQPTPAPNGGLNWPTRIQPNVSTNIRTGSGPMPTSTTPVGCQPLPAFSSTTPIVGSGSFPVPSFLSEESTSQQQQDGANYHQRSIDILQQALEIVQSEIGSISSSIGNDGSNSVFSREGTTTTARSSLSSSPLEEALNELNSVLSSSSSPSRQHRESSSSSRRRRRRADVPTSPTTSSTGRVPTVLLNSAFTRQGEVSMISSTIAEDEEEDIDDDHDQRPGEEEGEDQPSQ